ncbi:MAG: alpha/beta hydrolase [Betaproteobacteria bacterium]|nr:MAG: alpha/beta hydrolase [Betaproteobacteria bacterium]
MKIQVHGINLFFDTEGASLRASGSAMREVPTVILLHGGPGADHSIYKPDFSALTDVAQVIYLDHRGNGRSDDGPPELWTLAQWADDLVAFCEALGIVKPVVYGASFGGMVAMAYATRHPAHAGKLVLVSTSAQATSHTEAKIAMFTQLGGAAAGELARRRFVEGDTSPALLKDWIDIAFPLYTQTAPDPHLWSRIVMKQPVRERFFGSGGEGRTMDMLHELSRIQCPTLVMGGALDPMLPIECQRDIAAAMPQHHVRYREFANCGHGVIQDAPIETMELLRDFIAQ